jgi:hypothetical protein
MSDSPKKGPSGVAIAVSIGVLMVVAITARGCGSAGQHGGPPPGTPGGPPAANASAPAAATTYRPEFARCANASETTLRSCTFNADGSSGFNTELAGDVICTNLPAGPAQLFSIQDLEGGVWKSAATKNASTPQAEAQQLEQASQPVGAFRFVGNQGTTPVTVSYWAVKQGQPCGTGPSPEQ